MEFITSNGYVFFSVLMAAFLAIWIYLARGDFSMNGYSSPWGRFLNNADFWLWIKILAVSSSALFIVVLFLFGKKEMTWDDLPFRILLIVDLVGFLLTIIIILMCYCKWCWGAKSLGFMMFWMLLFCIPFGVYLLLTHPAIPDGSISAALKKAIKLNVDGGVMSLFKDVGLYRFSTYWDIFSNSKYCRIALYVWSGNCLLHLLLCNGWMHFNKLHQRALYPLITCTYVLLSMPVAIALSFWMTSLVVCGLVYLVYAVASLFMLGLTLALISAWWSENFGTGRSGRLSDGTKIRQKIGDQWVDEHGRNWRNIGGNEFERN